MAVLVVAALGLGGAGGYFTGAFDSLHRPALPLADPYVLTIEKPASGPVTAKGNVPSEATSTTLTKAVTDLGGTADLTLASGAIGGTWGQDVLTTLDAVRDLDSWKIDLTGDAATVIRHHNRPGQA